MQQTNQTTNISGDRLNQIRADLIKEIKEKYERKDRVYYSHGFQAHSYLVILVKFFHT